MSFVYGPHDWGPNFEPTVAAAFVLDEGFFRKYSPLIDIDAFSREEVRLVLYCVKGYWEAYDKLPQKPVLREWLRKSGHPETGNAIEWIEDLVLPDDVGYIADRVLEWVKWQQIHAAMLECQDDPRELATRITSASRLGDHLQMNHTRMHMDHVNGEVRRPQVPSPWNWLNDALGGGPEMQDMGIVVSFVNVGKTCILVNLARAALEQGKAVAYITFEDGEMKIKRRFLQSILGKTTEELLSNHGYTPEKNAFFQETGSQLHIKKLRSRRSTVEEAASFVESIQDEEGRKIDLLVTDYADRFASPIRKSFEPRHHYRAVFEECKAIANDLDLVHWTATQANRSRAGQETVRMEHVGESIGKVESADIVLGVGATREDEARGLLNFNLAKARDYEKGMEHPFRADFETQRIEE